LLTNLRPDHLARHPSMESYADIKRRLFVRGPRGVELAVLGADDELGRSLAAEVSRRGGEVARFGRAPEAEYRLLDCGWTLTSGWALAQTPDGRVRIETRLPGAHNAENALAALAAARGLGMELEPALAGLAQAKGVPGRFELIEEGQPFDVIVDFAHTPDGMAALLGAVRRIADARQGARVHVVIADAGHRPKPLRVPLGAAAGGLAERVIVTHGNPRGEPIEAPLSPLEEGARSAGRASVEVVRGRREAFRHAFATAGEGDLVVIPGRGVRGMITTTDGGEPIPFDDRTVAREELRALLGRRGTAGQSRVATTRA
jgi:UDP-N-acetylmuramoyl-L-alanyl-D-glutamate--2,6-diaminopimelate ligase